MERYNSNSLFSSAFSFSVPEDKALVNQVSTLLDHIYPTRDAMQHSVTAQFREQVLNQLTKLSYPLSFTERSQIKNLIWSLETIHFCSKKQLYPFVEGSNISTFSPPVNVHVFSHNYLSSSASLTYSGDIKIVLQEIHHHAHKQLTSENALRLKQLMNQYLILHYQDKTYSEIRLLDKTLPLSHLMNNLVIVNKPSQEQKEEEVLKQSHQASNSFDTLLYQTYEDTFTDYQKEAVEVKDIFRSKRANFQVLPKLVMLQGRAGIGKTTLCHQICHACSKPNGLWRDQFEWIIYLPLRELNQKIEGYGTTLEDAICYLLFAHPTAQGFTPIILQQLLNTLQDKVLFILDGYDELKLDSPFRHAFNQLLSIHTKAYVLVTARPFYTSQYTFDQTFEVVGFNQEKIHQYLQVYFQENKAVQQQMEHWLSRHPPIYSLAHVPILLGLICYLWEDPNQQQELIKQPSFTMTQLYTTLTTKLWAQYKKKQLETTKDSALIQLNEKTHLLRQFLQQLAFKALGGDEVTFDITTICQLGYKIFKDFYHLGEASDFEDHLEVVLQPGFLYKQGLGHKTRESYYFLHKTFQEFFAAQHIVSQMKANSKLSIYEQDQIVHYIPSQFIIRYKYHPRWEVVWWFVAGLLRQSRKGNKSDYFKELWISPPCDIFKINDKILLIRLLDEGCPDEELFEEIAKTIKETIQEIAKISAYTLYPFHQFFNYLRISNNLRKYVEEKNLGGWVQAQFSIKGGNSNSENEFLNSDKENKVFKDLLDKSVKLSIKTLSDFKHFFDTLSSKEYTMLQEDFLRALPKLKELDFDTSILYQIKTHLSVSYKLFSFFRYPIILRLGKRCREDLKNENKLIRKEFWELVCSIQFQSFKELKNLVDEAFNEVNGKNRPYYAWEEKELEDNLKNLNSLEFKASTQAFMFLTEFCDHYKRNQIRKINEIAMGKIEKKIEEICYSSATKIAKIYGCILLMKLGIDFTAQFEISLPELIMLLKQVTLSAEVKDELRMLLACYPVKKKEDAEMLIQSFHFKGDSHLFLISGCAICLGRVDLSAYIEEIPKNENVALFYNELFGSTPIIYLFKFYLKTNNDSVKAAIINKYLQKNLVVYMEDGQLKCYENGILYKCSFSGLEDFLSFNIGENILQYSSYLKREIYHQIPWLKWYCESQPVPNSAAFISLNSETNNRFSFYSLMLKAKKLMENRTSQLSFK